jgi:hypothetical protein
MNGNLAPGIGAPLDYVFYVTPLITRYEMKLNCLPIDMAVKVLCPDSTVYHLSFHNMSWEKVYSFFRSEFSTQCDIVFSLSSSSIFFFVKINQ